MTMRVPNPAVVASALLATGGVAIALWLNTAPTEGLALRIPGTDRPPGAGAASAELDIAAAGRLTRGDGRVAPRPAPDPAAWTRFRGDRLDGVSREEVPLARSWSTKGPPVLWSVDLGEGYAGPVVRDGRVYLIDYDQAKKADAVRCLSLDDGKEIWRFAYPVSVKRNHGMSRTVPTLAGPHVVSMGPKCHVTCLDAATGELRWAIDLVAKHGSVVPPWYAGQCPLVDGDRVILGVGGAEALVMAVDLATGRVLWKTPNPRRWQMTHTSVVPMTVRGRKTYVYAASGGVAGVAAEDGAALWETADWKIDIAAIPTPVVVGEDRLFLSGGYNAGAMMLRLKDEGGKPVPETLFRLKASVFGATQQTPILHGDRLYGVRPDGQFACLDLDGKVAWTSGAAHKFGLGPFLVAGDRAFLMNDGGLITMAEIGPGGFKVLAQAKVLEGQESWAPFALAGGRLLARDLTRMVCLDVRER
jgi:outer membrane protein assembly factor BamB